MMLACALLGTSRGVRYWQDYRFSAALKRSEAASFPLSELLKTIGDWQLQEGSATTLDPKVAQIAGCTDHIVGTYVNKLTGVSLSVLVLFGPAQVVSRHIPAVCYPSAGYKSIDEPMLHTIALGTGRRSVLLRSEVFARGEGASAEREEVYYAFRHDQRWFPDAADDWKLFRHKPCMFKVQTQRRVAEFERRYLNNPTEQFLGLLLAEIERCLSTSRAGPTD
jgi:Protein of unknown function (DUF3485)